MTDIKTISNKLSDLSNGLQEAAQILSWEGDTPDALERANNISEDVLNQLHEIFDNGLLG